LSRPAVVGVACRAPCRGRHGAQALPVSQSHRLRFPLFVHCLLRAEQCFHHLSRCPRRSGSACAPRLASVCNRISNPVCVTFGASSIAVFCPLASVLRPSTARNRSFGNGCFCAHQSLNLRGHPDHGRAKRPSPAFLHSLIHSCFPARVQLILGGIADLVLPCSCGIRLRRTCLCPAPVHSSHRCNFGCHSGLLQ
jgi:hypothetical protein